MAVLRFSSMSVVNFDLCLSQNIWLRMSCAFHYYTDRVTNRDDVLIDTVTR